LCWARWRRKKAKALPLWQPKKRLLPEWLAPFVQPIVRKSKWHSIKTHF
jgi:hypothetical protein